MLDCLVGEDHIGLLNTEQALQTLCASIFSEIKRLQKHPELFPSQKAREEFEKSIDGQRKLYDAVVTSHQNQSKSLASYLEGRVKRNEQIYRPFFKPTLRPWHQFLHNGAPGAAYKISKPKFGSGQIVPPGGLHILGIWLHENKLLMDKRNVVSLVLLPHNVLHLITFSWLLTAVSPGFRGSSQTGVNGQSSYDKEGVQWK